MSQIENYKKELAGVLSGLKDKKLMEDFLIDLLTTVEFREMAKRWQIVKQLAKKIPQKKISANLRVGLATVSRGARELQDKGGGFYKILNKQIKQNKQ